jgi:hypothetical protein
MQDSVLDGGNTEWGVSLRRATRDSKDGEEWIRNQAVRRVGGDQWKF